MEMIEFNEKDDGSAEIVLNLATDEVKLLVNYAINDMLRKGLEKEECSKT